MKRLILLPLMLLIGLAQAQSVQPSPQAIVVNPLPDPNFTAEVFLDKDPSGSGNPSYAVGESVRIGVRVNQASYIYLYDVKPSGQVTQILPNRFDAFGRNNFMQAGETKFFPPGVARYTFTIDPPNGLSKVIVVASRQPLSTGQLAGFEGGAALATSTIGESGFAGAFSIVVRPIPQQDWVTDIVLYTVHGGPSPIPPQPSPSLATLTLRSDPSGAEIFLDSRFVGLTPLTIQLASGSHNVQLNLPGYEGFNSSLLLASGEHQDLLIQLRRVSAVAPPAPATLAPVLFHNPFLLAFPDSTLYVLSLDNHKREATFAVQTNLETVYAHFHNQLYRLGWLRSEVTLRHDRIDAEYLLANQRIELGLRYQENNVFDLDIKFKGGNNTAGCIFLDQPPQNRPTGTNVGCDWIP